MEMVVTTRAVRRAKLQSHRHHQQTNAQRFTGRLSSMSLNQQCQSPFLFSIVLTRACAQPSTHELSSKSIDNVLSCPAHSQSNRHRQSHNLGEGNKKLRKQTQRFIIRNRFTTALVIIASQHAAHAQRDILLQIRPSVCPLPVPCLSEWTYRHTFTSSEHNSSF